MDEGSLIVGSRRPFSATMDLMRGLIFIIAGGATVAVGALAYAATSAYAAPISASNSEVLNAPALVVPLNYHPAASVTPLATSSTKGTIRVEPGAALDIAGAVEGSSGSSPLNPSTGTGGDSAAGAPSGSSTPPTSKGPGASGDPSESNAGNDLNNKGTGSRSSGSNNGNDLNNKGTGANKRKGKSDG